MFERSDFDSLDIFRIIDEFDFRLVEMMSVVLAEEQLLGFYSKFALILLGIGESLGIADGLVEMPGVFGEMDFAIHAICYFLVIDLLLDVEFG